MPIKNRFSELLSEITEWRRDIHENPELLFETHRTSSFVENRLKEFGCDDVTSGIGRTGVVGVIKGRTNKSGKVIALRADMDALPIYEATELDYKSKIPGLMHACGHDGHTAMLLGAAKYLAETRNFKGRVALIFQPDEEQNGGAEIMVNEGILDRFEIDQVYGIHNAPGHPLGSFYTMPGPIMAGADNFDIHISGQGGHGAYPQDTKDPVIAAVGIAQALQMIVSRNARAFDQLVVSVTQIHSGTVGNIIPQTAFLNGTVRTFDPEVQHMVKSRMAEIVAGQAASYGVDARLVYEEGYPPTINDPEKAAFAANVARQVAADGNVLENGY